MSGRAVTLELPEEVQAAIREAGERTGRDFSAVASEMRTEAVKMRRFPGIVFADGPDGRVARIAATDTEVGSIIATYNRLGRDRERLRQACSDLGEQQIDLAPGYWRAYRQEVEAQLDAELHRAVEAVWEKYPATRPRWR